mgnify:CR=1 FL=1
MRQSGATAPAPGLSGKLVYQMAGRDSRGIFRKAGCPRGLWSPSLDRQKLQACLLQGLAWGPHRGLRWAFKRGMPARVLSRSNSWRMVFPETGERSPLRKTRSEGAHPGRRERYRWSCFRVCRPKQQIRGNSEKTLVYYRSSLSRAAAFLGEGLSLDDLTLSRLRESSCRVKG